MTTDVKKMNLKDYVFTFLKGILLGLISVGIPGLSASTIGIIIGIYFVLVESIANIFSDFKNNIKFLISIILGYGVGAVGAAYSITILFDHFALITTLAILGFILGSIPDMVVQLRSQFKSASNWIVFVVIVFLLVMYNFTLVNGSSTEFPKDPSLHFLIGVIFMGLVTSATFVIPGVDFAVVFLSLGIYYPFTNMITELLSFNAEIYRETLAANLKILGFYLIGYFIGMFLFSKLIKFLNRKYNSQTQFASLAFVCAAPAIVIKDCVIDNQSFRTSVGQWIVGVVLFLTFFLLMIIVGFLNTRKRTRYYTFLWTHFPGVMKLRKSLLSAVSEKERCEKTAALLSYATKKQKIAVSVNDMPAFTADNQYVLSLRAEQIEDVAVLLSTLSMPAYIPENEFPFPRDFVYGVAVYETAKNIKAGIRIVNAETYLPAPEDANVFSVCVRHTKNLYVGSAFAPVDCEACFRDYVAETEKEAESREEICKPKEEKNA